MSGVLIFLAGASVGILLRSFRKRQPAASVDENGHWSFPVDTFAQMIAIPCERRERFLAELPLSLRRIWEMQDAYPLVPLPGAVWVDDGLGEFRPEIVNAPENVGAAFSDRPLGKSA